MLKEINALAPCFDRTARILYMQPRETIYRSHLREVDTRFRLMIKEEAMLQALHDSLNLETTVDRFVQDLSCWVTW